MKMLKLTLYAGVAMAAAVKVQSAAVNYETFQTIFNEDKSINLEKAADLLDKSAANIWSKVQFYIQHENLVQRQFYKKYK